MIIEKYEIEIKERKKITNKIIMISYLVLYKTSEFETFFSKNLCQFVQF